MIDSHAHLADPQFAADLPAVLERASLAGITHILCIADSLPEAELCIELADRHHPLFATVGIHPHNAKDWNSDTAEHILALVAQSGKVRAIGEIGLDYHYDRSPRDIQKQAFAEQLLIAKKLNMPAVVHCREAVSDVITVIKDVDYYRLVLHCCSEQWSDVQELVEQGVFLSFTGIATYPGSDVIRDTIKHCPMDQLMIETDAPYLSPVPHRGKRNEPAFVVEVAKTIAQIKGESQEDVTAQTARNAVEFFGLPVVP